MCNCLTLLRGVSRAPQEFSWYGKARWIRIGMRGEWLVSALERWAFGGLIAARLDGNLNPEATEQSRSIIHPCANIEFSLF